MQELHDALMNAGLQVELAIAEVDKDAALDETPDLVKVAEAAAAAMQKLARAQTLVVRAVTGGS